MSKYSDLVASFFDEYEQPKVQDYTVGFSGIDPDRKIKPEVIDHEQLYGLLGGAVAGHYHITQDQLQKLKAYEGQISALQSSLSAAIKTAENAIAEAERVLGARITSTENTQATLTQNQNALLNAVSGLQGSARDLSERMTGAENAQAALTASQRTLTQATEYIDAEEKKLAKRMTAAEGVQSTLQAGQSSLSGRIDTLNATANTIAGRVSKTETAQASLEGTQANFAVRLDTIQNEATTDTEILDARVDADNVPHVTLGDHIRSLHRLTVEQSERAHEAERVIADYAREMADDVAGMALDTRAILHDVKEDLSGVTGDVDDLIDRTYALEYGLEDETSGRMTADRALSGRVDTVQGDLASEISQRKVKDSEIQADLNRANVSIAETIVQLASEVAARKAKDEEISGRLEGEITDRAQSDIDIHESLHAILDYAREQSDFTAVALLEEILRRHEADTRLEDEISHEVSQNDMAHQWLREDTTANAEGVMRLAGIFKDYTAKREFEHDHETAQQVAREDQIRNDISELASGVINVACEIRRANEYFRKALEHKSIIHSADTVRLQEQNNDNAYAEIQNTRLIHNVAEKYRTSKAADLAHIEGLYLSGTEHVREQLDTLAGVCLSMMAGTYSRLRDMEKTIARINDEIASGLDGSADDEEIFEAINDIFAGDMSVNTSGDDEFDSMIYDIFNNPDVNP